MSTVFFVLFVVSLVAVVVSLLAGVVTLGRPGEDNRRRSNLLMRARIASQVAVIVFLVLYLLTR